MKAIVQILFVLICLPILGIQAIISIFKKKEPTTEERIKKAKDRELMNWVKRKITTWVILLCAITVQAQIKSSGSIEIGWKDGIYEVFRKNVCLSGVDLNNIMYADIKLGFEWKFIKVEQMLSNNIKPIKFTLYMPIDIEYRLRFSFNHKKLSLGYEHVCLHPVVTQFSDLESNYRRSGEDKIFLKFEW